MYHTKREIPQTFSSVNFNMFGFSQSPRVSMSSTFNVQESRPFTFKTFRRKKKQQNFKERQKFKAYDLRTHKIFVYS